MERNLTFYKLKWQISTFEISFFLCLSFFVTFSVTDVFSQVLPKGKTVSGKVVSFDGEELPGVAILIEGTSIGTVSEIDGTFSIKIPSDTETLTFRMVGFKEQKLSVVDKTAFHVVMQEDIIAISEVVVVGYGTQDKATVTGAISMVKTKDLLQSPQANISNALVGRMPGLISVQHSGAPGQDASTLRIRGVGTFAQATSLHDPSAPLIMVDGIEANTFNNIDPNEIESISILKDASATAVYGIRGANGVIIITTRRGAEEAPKISYSSNFSVSTFTETRENMGSYEWAKTFNAALKNDAYFRGVYIPKFSESEIQRYRLNSSPLFYPNTDWTDILLKDWAYQNQHNINISGGTNRVKYFVSLGYLFQDGLYKNTDVMSEVDYKLNYNRYNFRSNLDFNVTNDFDINLSISNQLDTRSGPQYDVEYVLSTGYKAPPNLSPGIVDGKLSLLKNRDVSIVNNPLGNMLRGPYNKEQDNNLNFQVRANYNLHSLLKGLSTHATLSYQNYYWYLRSYHPELPYYYLVQDPEGGPRHVKAGQDRPPSLNTGSDKRRKVDVEIGVDYENSFGSEKEHNVTALLVYNQRKLFDPRLKYGIPNAHQGIVVRTTYDYKMKYLLELNVGYNGTENFIKGKRFGLFPALSAGWVVSEEEFFPSTNAIPFLKIRGSYGEVGNDWVGNDRFLYLPTSYTMDGGGGFDIGYWFGEVGVNASKRGSISEGILGNPDLTWERSRKINIGIEARLLDDKISLVGDYFYEKRNNILTRMGTAPIITGAELPAYNLGIMKNQGFDGELTFRDRISIFSYWVKGIFTFARNKVLEMDEVEPRYPYLRATGHPNGQYFGLIAEGFYNTWEEVNDPNRPRSIWDNNMIQPGDVKFKDVNSDGVINQDDRVPIGYSNFPEIMYGLSFGGNFKRLDFSVLFQGAANQSRAASITMIRGFVTDGGAPSHLNDYCWTPEKYESGQKISFPRLSVSSEHNYQRSTLWVRDSKYLRLKNIEIGYTFDGNLFNRLGITSTRIYVNSNNLYTWHNLLKGEDPEIPFVGDGNYEPYPTTAVYNLGFNFNF
jgi:TonB-linked SusC/RagA family outer membrane protein